MLNIANYQRNANQNHNEIFTSVKFSLSVMSHSATPWTAARQASLSITNSQSLLKLMSIESVMPSNHLILCRPLLLLSIFPSIRAFSNELALCIRSPKCWSFSFSISPCSEYSALISFMIDWFDLFAVQGTLKSLLQHSSKASILQCLAFFIVQLSHPYMTTGKTIALTRQTFVGKKISIRMGKMQSTDKTKCWWRCGATGAFIHFWWECKMVLLLWNTVWCFLTRPIYTFHKILWSWFWAFIQGAENLRLHKNLYVDIYSIFIYNFPNLETTNLPFSGWRHK